MVKKKPAKPERSKQLRQGMLPGTIPEASKELLAKTEDLVRARENRITWLKKEVDLQGEVIELMHAEKVDSFSLSSGRGVALTKTDAKEKVKFTTSKVED